MRSKTKLLMGKNKTNIQKNFSPKPRTEQHSIWVSKLVTGMGYLAYLPFQDYSCQVLIRVIRVKNVISFQGYFEQIPLISFLKERRGRQAEDFAIREAKALCLSQRTFKPLPRTPSISAGLAQSAEGCCSSAFLPSFLPETKFQSASANKSTFFSLPAPVLLPFSDYYYSLRAVIVRGKGCQSDWLHVRDYSNVHPFINCSWTHLYAFLCASSLVWSVLLALPASTLITLPSKPDQSYLPQKNPLPCLCDPRESCVCLY